MQYPAMNVGRLGALALALVVLLFAVPEVGYARAPCSAANPNDSTSDDAALNACFAGGGTVNLVTGSPGYIVQSGLYINNSVIVDGSATGARLNAHTSLNGPILRVGFSSSYVPTSPVPSNITLTRIILDGNRYNRSTSICASPSNNRSGYNLMIKASNFSIDTVYSVLALCGTAAEVVGTDFEIVNSVFNSNHGDGLTVVECNNGVIEDNGIFDNEDVGLAVGIGTGTCSVRRNNIYQATVHAHAGLLVGFHSGAVVWDNSITSGYNLMKVGIVVGGHIWNGGSATFGAGDIQYNYVSGAVVLGVIDGISSGTFTNNIPGTAQGTTFFSNCASWYNLVYIVNTSHIGSATIQPGYNVRNLDSCYPPP